MTYTSSQAQAGRGSVLAIGATHSITGSTTSGSATVSSVSSTAGITVGMLVAGDGIPAGTNVTAIGSGTLTLSAKATATASDVALMVGPTAIGEVKNNPVNRGKWKTVDVTNYESGSDEEVLTVIRETGSIAVEGNRVSSDAGQVLVEAAYQDGSLQSFTLTLPETSAQSTKGDVYTFDAYVTASDFTVDVEKEIDFKLTLLVSGGMTLTVGS